MCSHLNLYLWRSQKYNKMSIKENNHNNLLKENKNSTNNQQIMKTFKKKGKVKGIIKKM